MVAGRFKLAHVQLCVHHHYDQMDSLLLKFYCGQISKISLIRTLITKCFSQFNFYTRLSKLHPVVSNLDGSVVHSGHW